MRHLQTLARTLPLLLGALMAGPVLADKADPVGEVSTAFKLLGPNHKILVEAFDDPKIAVSPAIWPAPRPAASRADSGWRKIPPTPPSHATRSAPSPCPPS